MSVHIVVMGVSGCGKTTVMEALSKTLGFIGAEGDEFHSQENVEKMSNAIPLTDEDRWPWLRSINAWMKQQDAADRSTIISCSSLKRAYRDVLRDGIDVFFIHLVGSEQLIASRMNQRVGHYMPTSLLPSQFADLEPLEADEPGCEIDIAASASEVEAQSLQAVKQYESTLS